jgi:hypothetical protein
MMMSVIRTIKCVRPMTSLVKSSSSALVDMPRNAYSSSACVMKRTIKYDTSSAKNFDAFFEKKDKIDEQIPIGRGWTSADLRRKSFDDLHRLWFILYKERNMLLSERQKGQRMNTPIAPLDESRYMKVKRSMGAIKHVLNERSTIKRELELQNLVAEIDYEINNENTVIDDETNIPGVIKLADTKPGGISR